MEDTQDALKIHNASQRHEVSHLGFGASGCVNLTGLLGLLSLLRFLSFDPQAWGRVKPGAEEEAWTA